MLNPSKVAVINTDNPKPFGRDTPIYSSSRQSPHIGVGVNERFALNLAGGLANEGINPIYIGPAEHMTINAEDWKMYGFDKRNILVVGLSAGSAQGKWGPAHLTYQDIDFFRTPNATVYQPANTNDLEILLEGHYEQESPGPVYIRLPENQFIGLSPQLYDSQAKRQTIFEDGFYEVASFNGQSKSPVILVVSGKIVSESLQAAEELERNGITYKIINVINLSEINKEKFNIVTAGAHLIVTAIDAKSSSLSGLAYNALSKNRDKVVALGVDNGGSYDDENIILHANKLDAQGLVETILKSIDTADFATISPNNQEHRDFAAVSNNPLDGLHDPKVREVYESLVSERLNYDIHASYYGLGKPGEHYILNGQPLTRERLAHVFVNFLVTHSNLGPINAAKAFREEFEGSRTKYGIGLSSETDDIAEAYSKVGYELRPGFMMVKDLITTEQLSNGVVVDVGCGNNSLNVGIAEYAQQKGIKIKSLIGTDIGEKPVWWTSPNVHYLRQPSPQELPLDDHSVDLVTLKWSIHHMTQEEYAALMKEVYRILKPGGKVVIIEALMGNKEDLQASIDQESQNSDLWPQGPWYSVRREITKKYLELSLKQQKAFLLMEDYFGHWLDSGRMEMPLTANYMSPQDLEKSFFKNGMHELIDQRRVFGFAPLLRPAPPSIRYVYEKPNDQKIPNGENGGIDLTPANMHLQTQNKGGGIRFHFDPAMLQRLQKAPGFIPVVVSIHSTNLRIFLGLAGNQSPQTI